MPILGSIPISATSASIKFDGEVVGYLQNLRIKEDFNVKQVNEIGNNIGRGFVAGAFIGEATAKKAFIETNLLLDFLKPAINANMAANMGVQDFTKFIGNNNLRKTTNFALDTVKAVSDLVSSFKGDKLNKNNFILKFDIEVTAPREYTTAAIRDNQLKISHSASVNRLEEQTLFLLKDCVITSREITIDTNELVVMNNLSIRFLSREV